MDREKKLSKFNANRNSKIYMDLKDIIRENALPFLPAKALFRCTSVCRDWKLQISTPFFAHSQSNCFHDVSGFFCQSQSCLLSFISLDQMAYGVPDPSLKFLPEPVRIRCSSNGLLCCQGCTGYNAYYICNPVTKQWKKLPEPNANHGPDPAVVLVFEPSLLNFVAEYKLVCAFPSDLDGYEFEIYSSAEGSWKISGEILFGRRQIIPTTGVHVNGIVYWQTDRTVHSGLVAFDLTSERSTLPYNSHGSLGQVNGRLYSASIVGSKLTVQEMVDAHTNTMQMNSRTRAWKVKHDIILDNTGLGECSFNHASVLFIGGDIVLIQSVKALVSYNMKTKKYTRLAAETGCTMRMVPCVNSLVEL